MADAAFLKSATTSATFTVLSQFVFRLTTFLLNAVILRKVSIDLLGIVNVRLTLLYTTILFISREPFRKACLSSSSTWAVVKNVTWLVLPIGALVSFALSLVWDNLLELPSGAVADYSNGVVLFAVSALIELASEPLNIRSQLFLWPGVRVVAIGLAVFARCTLVCVYLYLRDTITITEYGYAQVLYSAVLLGWFVVDGARKEGLQTFVASCLPGSVHSHGIHWPTVHLAWTFFKQSLLKQLLSEGERYVMTVLNVISFSEQGIFDVVNNLGSSVVRFFFLPIEESFYPYFGSCLPRVEHLCLAIAPDPARDASTPNDANDGSPRVSADLASSATATFATLVRLMTMIALLGIFFGPPSSPLLMYLYGGSGMLAGSGPLLLQVYCVYVALLAVNGITEGFVSAVAPRTHLDKTSRVMVGISIVFLASSVLLSREFGAVGIVLANCVNIAARLVSSFLFIRQYYAHECVRASGVHRLPDGISFTLGSLLPSATTLQAILAAFCTLFAFGRFTDLNANPNWRLSTAYIGLAGLLLGAVLLAAFLRDKALVNGALLIYRKRRSKSG